MDVRRIAAHKVLVEGWSVSEAAREFGLSRPTVRTWVGRAQDTGFAGLSERSRRPHRLSRATGAELVDKVLEAKARRPTWGAKKIVASLWPEDPPVCVRTVDRILKREGLVKPRGALGETHRFEREKCNELWQMDFKGLGSPRLGYSPLSVLDDHSRYCLAFEPVGAHSVSEVWPVLWSLFGRCGLPDAVLTDNEPLFHTSHGYGPSPIEARLWLLGVRTAHCRVAHPQTQGKVERFHRTVQCELGTSLRQASMALARPLYRSFVEQYNWERPHEALELRVPGAVYFASGRSRPSQMPVHRPLGQARKVDCAGKFRFRSRSYKAGCGLTGEYVDVRGEEVFYAGRMIGSLVQLAV